jgi:hypothetical protein
MDFNTAWKRARSGQQSGLFASEYAYGYPNTQRHNTSKRTPLTPQQKSYQQATYHASSSPVWPEFAGHSSHRTPGVSQIVMEANSRKAQAVFAQAEYTLSKFKSRW